MNRFICCIVEFMIAAALVACGGGTEPFASPPVAAIKATAPAPAKKATTVTGGNAVVIHLYQALYGMAPSNALLIDYGFQATNDASLFAKNLTDRFTTTSHADLAKLVLDNLGVTATTVPAINAKGEREYALLLDAVKQLFAAYPTMRGQVILNMTDLLAGLESDATYGGAAIAYNSQAKSNLAYGSNSVNTDTKVSSSQDVACSVQKNNYGDVAYPPEYLGAFPIPTPTQKLPANVIRSITLKDDWITRGGPWSPTSGSGCTDQVQYAHNLWAETLDRIQRDGADKVWIYNTAAIIDITKSIYIKGANAISDSDLKFVVDEAHKRHLKIYYSWQYQTSDELGHSFPNPSDVTLDDLRKMLNSYHDIIVEQAKYANQIGIDGIQADWAWPWVEKIRTDIAFKKLWCDELSTTIDDIRSVFSGRIVVGFLNSVINSEIAKKIDALGIVFIIRISDVENNDVTVDLLKSKYLAFIRDRYTAIASDLGGSVNIPIIWYVSEQSRRDFLMNGWTEDDFCVQNCIQRSYVTDFSVQAIAYEAVLQAITFQQYFSTYEVDLSASGYWYSDEIVPRRTDETGFPNLGQTIRNKPAEGIAQYWFGR